MSLLAADAAVFANERIQFDNLIRNSVKRKVIQNTNYVYIELKTQKIENILIGTRIQFSG